MNLRVRPDGAGVIVFLLTSFLLTGCASSSSRSHRTAAVVEPQPYMRVANPDSNTVSLQIALRRFVPENGSGPEVWLVGASHVGDSNYFATLQKHLDAQPLVLFEGVGGKSKKKMRFDPEEETSIQHTMASALGLVFQLSAIDYDRPQFRNSDLTIGQLQQLMAGGTNQPGQGGGSTPASREFQELLQVMDGSSMLGTLLHVGLKFIGSSPKLQAMTKVVLIETLGQMTGDMSQIKGMPPEIKRLLSVIIQERNKVVLDDLRKELRAVRPAKAVSVFYGAGHMADLEKRLRSELRYRPRGEVWLTAMSVDLRASGLSAAEMEAMRGLIRWQMEALKSE